jgi:hypothetical protein
MKRIMVLLVAFVMVFGLAAQSRASLTVIGNGTITSDGLGDASGSNGVGGTYQLIYESGQNITWLDYSATPATWQNQVNWANNLAVSYNGQNLTGWSLPKTVDSSSSSVNNPPSSSSQMAYLYFTDLGNTGWPNIGMGLNNVGPFKNLVSSLSSCYWSGTAYSANANLAWGFGTGDGLQGLLNTDGVGYGLAVLPGDAAAPTPIPGTMVLFGPGLMGLAGWRKWAARRW